jgi:TRAP-type C4-dicarboxylate transport system substrate-binding protein
MSIERTTVRTHPGGIVAVVTVMAIGAMGCGGAGDDRAGGKRPPKAVTLTLANPLPQPDELRPFVDEVERISDGKIEISFRNGWLGWPWRRTEAALIRDVAAGRADLGWVGSRAWTDVGVTSFDALHAPFVVDSYELEGSVLEAGVADELLEGVEPLGLVGLGVLPGPLRKVLGVDRLFVRPADFAGARIGLNASQVGSASMRALGALPVTVPGGVDLVGQVDGLEHHVASIDGNTYDDAARYLTANVNLWPRWVVVFMNAKVFAALHSSQQDALREAVKRAIPTMLSAAEGAQEASTAVLCDRGLTLAVASQADLAELRAAVAPVLASIGRDSITRSALLRIDDLRRQYPSAPDSIAPCPGRSTSKASRELDGTYVTVTTAADARRARIQSDDPLYKHLPIRLRLVLEGGVYKLYQRERDGTHDVHGGTYTIYRDRIVLIDPPDRLPFAWSFDGKTLTFDDEGKGGYFGAFWAQPWTKVR